MPVKVTLDIARPRVTRAPLFLKADGRVWDLPNSSNVFLDPITLSIFLRPQVLTATWDSTTSGSYARFGIADYEKEDGTNLTSDDWAENNYSNVSGNVRLESRGVNYAVFTQDSWPANQPFFVSYYMPHGSKQSDTVFECGWGDPGESGTISLRVSGSGRCEVYKGTTFLKNYTVSGATIEMQRIAGQAQTVGQGGGFAEFTPGANDPAGKVVNLYLMPCRRRELLVFGSSGGGFSHVFEDLSSTAVNDITPDAVRFWWRVAQGKASVQCAPMIFPTSGYVLGPTYELREAPQTGETPGFLVAWDESVSGSTDDATSSLVQSNGTTAFTPNGSATTARIRVDLSSDGSNSPAVYAADAEFGSLTVDTDGAHSHDITSFITSLDFKIPEDSETSGTMHLRGPDTMATAGIPAIATQNGRPFKVEVARDGDTAGTPTYFPFLVGITGEPTLTEAPVIGDDDKGRRIDIEWHDLWQQLNDIKYEDEPSALDGFTWKDAAENILQAAGIPSAEWDVEDIAFSLPYTTAVSKGEWSFKIDQAARPGDVLKKLFQTYSPTFYMAFSPVSTGTVASGVRFRLQSRDALGDTEAATLYTDELPGSPANTDYICRKFQERTLPPECTRVVVFGYDPRRRILLKQFLTAPTLEDPSTVPSLRPPGWYGTIVPLFVRDPAYLTTITAVNRLADELMTLFATEVRMAEWESTLLLDTNGIPLWRGQVARIVGKGTYRIESFSGELAHEAKGFTFRKVRYVGRRIAADE